MQNHPFDEINPSPFQGVLQVPGYLGSTPGAVTDPRAVDQLLVSFESCDLSKARL